MYRSQNKIYASKIPILAQRNPHLEGSGIAGVDSNPPSQRLFPP